MKYQRHHSLLWWLIIIISVVFSGFMLAIHMGFFKGYAYALDHFSFGFFILLLILTTLLSYKRSRERHGKNYLAPLLSSVFFAIMTQFFIFLAAPFIEVNENAIGLEMLKIVGFFILPSLIAFLLVKALAKLNDIDGSADFLDLEFYIKWSLMMTGIMTVISFIELFFPVAETRLMVGLRGTVWGFYSLVLSNIVDSLEKRKIFHRKNK